MRVVCVIPARYASTRLPGKPLAKIHNKPMIQWVYERSKKSKLAHKIIVATDDQRIQVAVEAFGGEVMMTDPALPSGTDRVAAVSEQIDADIFVNVQGDEPMIEGAGIDQAIELIQLGRFQMSTLMTPIQDQKELLNPNVVKVICDHTGRAIYFSRHPIPYSRQVKPPDGRPYVSQRHLGLYAYTRETLQTLSRLPITELEQAESLEQLRALDGGIAIGCAPVGFLSIGVDTAEDLETVKRYLGSDKKGSIVRSGV